MKYYQEKPNPILERSGAILVNYDSTNTVLPDNRTVLAGTPVRYRHVSGVEEMFMFKSGKVYEAVAVGTTIKLAKEHSFGVLDSIFDGATEVNITAIDDSNDNYDSVTVDANVSFDLNETIYNIEDGDINSLSGVGIVTDSQVWEEDETPNAFAVTFNATLDIFRMPNFWAKGIEIGNIVTVPAEPTSTES